MSEHPEPDDFVIDRLTHRTDSMDRAVPSARFFWGEQTKSYSAVELKEKIERENRTATDDLFVKAYAKITSQS